MNIDGNIVLQVAGLAALLAGAGFIALTGVGLLRLPDMLCRSHAVAKGQTLGIFLMLLAYWLLHDGDGIGWRVSLAIFFQALTTPVASHLLARTAWMHRSGGGESQRRPAGRRRRR